jgi:hypothetical protein
MDEQNQKSPEEMFGRLMADFGSEMLSKILNQIELIKKSRLDEIGQLNQEIAARREEIVSVKRLLEDLSNKSAELGAQYLRLKAERKKFILGEDIDAAKFLSDMKTFREGA